MTDIICPDCEGEGKLVRCDYNGEYEIPCPYCNNSCGMIPSSEEEEEEEEECLVYDENSEDFFKDRELDK